MFEYRGLRGCARAMLRLADAKTLFIMPASDDAIFKWIFGGLTSHHTFNRGPKGLERMQT